MMEVLQVAGGGVPTAVLLLFMLLLLLLLLTAAVPAVLWRGRGRVVMHFCLILHGLLHLLVPHHAHALLVLRQS